jgi:hypothetical protein
MQLRLDQEQYRSDHSCLRNKAHAMDVSCVALGNQFDTHSLEEQSVVNLADRTDSKFPLPVRVLPRFLEDLSADYSVLEESGHRVFTYENTYFDTPLWDFFLQHHNGKLNRHKFRLRHYLETDISYFEKKCKTNKNRTVKERVPCIISEPTEVSVDDNSVIPSLYVNYRRITLWNRVVNERLTLDYDLYYRRPMQQQGIHLDRLLIAELKRFGKANGSPFLKYSKKHGLTPQSFSKYCMGVCMTDDGTLKKNRFKSTLSKVERIDNL